MHRYGVRDVERLLRLPRRTIQSLIDAGFVSPARGPRRSYLFSFQDLIVLRTAQALAASQVPSRRITKSLKELRRRLPDAMPLSGLSIGAVGDRVVVKEGASRWQAESGQYLLAFEGDPAEGSLSVIERNDQATAESAEDWFERGRGLERGAAAAAREAYERAIEADPKHLGAYINLGRLLHESSGLADAERIYRKAITACGGDPLLLFNFGVLLEDMNRKNEAMDAYKKALHGNPRMADCHYNLALLCKELNDPRRAIRHMAQYRKLVDSRR
ncbi:MAG TPA: tetratricopeptide repeat protein [Burkholderiales bacterium]|nr:tetratricopeptide repeat protein [Burkholderiales bacterium]